MMNVSSSHHRGFWLRIAINGVTHLSYRTIDLVGVQTWVQGNGIMWVLELTLKDGVILAEYDGRATLEAVLKEVEASQ